MNLPHVTPGRGVITAWLSLVGLVAWFGAAATVESATVTLAWDPPTLNVDGTPLVDLAGYKVRYGTVSQSYTAVVDAGGVTHVTLTGLVPGVTNFFVVTCYNALGLESQFSQELAWVPPAVESPFPDEPPWAPPDGVAAPILLRPNLAPGVTEPAFVVTWSSEAGVYYEIARSTNLTAVPAFAAIASNIPGQGSITVYADAGATGRGPYYYRVTAMAK
jgi:hypothetical protein